MPVPLIAALLVAPLLVAQPRVPGYRQNNQKTTTVDAEIKAMQPGRLIVEVDGETGPIALDRNTRLTVTGEVDRAFLQSGSVVEVSGFVREGGRIGKARLTLHTDPQQTAKPRVRKVKVDDKQVAAVGRVVSLEPLAVVFTDGLAMVGQPAREGDRPPESRPVYNQRMLIEEEKPTGPIKANFGPAVQLIEENAEARIVVPESGPRVARSVTVTRDGVITREDLTGKKDGEKDGEK